jgi:hypothetical protein
MLLRIEVSIFLSSPGFQEDKPGESVMLHLNLTVQRVGAHLLVTCVTPSWPVPTKCFDHCF